MKGFGWSREDVDAHNRRVLGGSFSQPQESEVPAAVAAHSERELHDDIMRHCDKQWPRWKYIHARMDQKSTVAVGSQDFTIFASGGRTFCIEVKTRNGKLSEDQLAWRKEMEMLGHTVHLVKSMEQFIEVCRINAS